jgi:hypothetical protein
VLADRFRASFDEVGAWPLPRVLAANDLIDELARAEREAADEREARRAAAAM